MTDCWHVLLNKLSEQKAELEAMLELAQKQLDAARDEAFPGNIDVFQLLVGKRQELMQKLETMQADIGRLESELASELGADEFSLKALKGRVSDLQYAEMARHLAELGDVLSRINRIDEELEATALSKLKAGIPERNFALKSQQAVRAYRETFKNKEFPTREE